MPTSKAAKIIPAVRQPEIRLDDGITRGYLSLKEMNAFDNTLRRNIEPLWQRISEARRKIASLN